MDVTIIFAVLAAVGVLGVYWLITRLVDKPSTVDDRVKDLIAREDSQQKDDAAGYFHKKEESRFAEAVSDLLKLMGVDFKKYKQSTQLFLDQAGIHNPDALMFYILAKKVGPLIGVALFAVSLTFVADMTGMTRLAGFLASLFFLVMGIWGADVYVKNRKDKRQVVLQRSFPDMLDLILVCVESGLALDAALGRVCRELESAHPEITRELNRTRMELTLMNDREAALQNLALRTDMIAFRNLVSALLQAEKFGTSLSETLRVLSEDYRNMRLAIAEQKAGRLPALMTVPMMLLLMPALFLIILGPAVIKVVDVYTSQ